MPQSLANMLVHLVFSTKNREPLILESIENQLYPYLASILETCDSNLLGIGGTHDHIHILFKVSRKRSMAEIVESLKSDSSKWIKTKGLEYARFYWQAGYGVFSVSPTHIESVKGYIASQKAHHRKRTFQEEYRELLRLSGTEFDERYVWD